MSQKDGEICQNVSDSETVRLQQTANHETLCIAPRTPQSQAKGAPGNVIET